MYVQRCSRCLKTGGLADVIRALPAAQIADGVDARVLVACISRYSPWRADAAGSIPS
ncbi:glycogen/starch synthase [Shigella sonnei]